MLSKNELIIRKKLEEKKLFQNRFICLNKLNYLKKNPCDIISLDGNIYIFDNDIYKKVWTGDLNLNIDGYILKMIKKETNIELYITSEKEGSISNKNKNFIWDTSKEIPITTAEDIKNYKENENKKIIKQDPLEELKLLIEQNNKYNIEEIKTILGNKIIKKIKIPYEKMFQSKHRRTPSYLSEVLIDEELQRCLLLKNESLNYSKFAITKATLDKIIAIDKEIDSTKKGQRQVTSNFKIINIELANSERKNIKSYSDDFIYVFDNFNKY